MRLAELLLSFKGRAGRLSWWTGLLIVGLVSVAGSLILDPGIWLNEPRRAPSLLLALWNMALVVPMTAVAVKRFNDRDWPHCLGYAMGALGWGLIMAEQAGFMVEPEKATSLERGVFWSVVLVFLAAIADNGFLRGTPGPNRNGPDPLGA